MEAPVIYALSLVEKKATSVCLVPFSEATTSFRLANGYSSVSSLAQSSQVSLVYLVHLLYIIYLLYIIFFERDAFEAITWRMGMAGSCALTHVDAPSADPMLVVCFLANHVGIP